MISRQVFSPVDGKHKNDKNIVLNQIDQTVSLFSQFDLVTTTQIAVQLRTRHVGLVQTFF